MVKNQCEKAAKHHFVLNHVLKCYRNIKASVKSQHRSSAHWLIFSLACKEPGWYCQMTDSSHLGSAAHKSENFMTDTETSVIWIN